MPRSFRVLLAVGVLVAGGVSLRAEEDVSTDEARLKESFQPVDNAGLVTFFKLRAQGESSATHLQELVDILSGKDATARQKACAELVAVGAPAIPLLRQAARDADAPETASLARRCLVAIETDQGATTASAARLLAHRRVGGTAEVLLAYLPHSENETVLEEVKNALMGVTYDKGKPDPAVLKALEDEQPLRRASAIVALCQGGIAEPRAALRKLLNDPSPSVRLRASLALGAASDAKAVSTLVALLGELPNDQTREVESFLSDLAGDLGPRVAVGDDDGSRLKARDAWAKWWLDTEGPGLLDELRKRTLKEVDRDKAVALIDKLSDDSFEERQKAEKELISMGVQIVPLLRQAFRHTDLEVRKRSAACLEIIEKEKPTPLSPVTARLVALRKPAGAVDAILNYLPFAEDDNIVEELQTTLNAVAFKGGKADPALLKALNDKVGVRRSAAATALAFGPLHEHLPTLRKMLKDRDPQVRLSVALALAGARESEAVPVLIALVGEVPGEVSAPAEDYLARLARDTGPKDLPEGEDNRKKRSEMWERWWDTNKDRVVLVDRYSASTRERYLGYLLLVQANNQQIQELGPDRKVRWTMTGLQTPIDAQVLPGNRVLIAEAGTQQITERDLKGNVLKSIRVPSSPVSAERLRNGHTFVVCRNLLIEFNREGREVWRLDRPGSDVMSARKLPSGQIVMVTNVRQVIRMDRAGKQLKNYTVANVFYNTNEILNNGHVLLPLGWQNMVVEYDTEGKEVNRYTVTQPNHACRLPDGRTLVATQPHPYKIYDLDKKGRPISDFTPTIHPFRVKPR